MWTVHSKQLATDRAIKLAINDNSTPISYAETLHRWQKDADFRRFFIGLLVNAPFSAFRWETPPITTTTANRAFEFVLLDSPRLARPPNTTAFSEHFRTTAMVVEFSNLSKDAIMVVPCPTAGGVPSNYCHLGVYSRQAPESQQHALWQLVGTAMQHRLSSKPVWLSSAGAGVAWLHIRLDDYPKYYGHMPYQREVSVGKELGRK